MSSLNQIGIHLWNWVSGATEDEAEDSTRDTVRAVAWGILTAAAVGGLAYSHYRRNQWRLDVGYDSRSETPNPSNNHPSTTSDVRLGRGLGKTLYCHDSHLTKAPDVSNNPQLQTLNLYKNRLTEAPGVSNNPQLRELSISRNRLTTAPDVSNNSQLQEFRLYKNRLTEAPNVSNNPQLQVLLLSSNQLTEAPAVSNNLQIRSLDLSKNRLTETPDVSHNSQLRWLNLSHNQLTIAPDVSHSLQLQRLDLSDNRLTVLPDFILSLPRDCNVNVENNLFSAEYVEGFQARLQQHRREHPYEGPTVHFSIADADPSAAILPLDEELSSWSEECEGHVEGCFTSLLSLDAETQATLSRYLGRLRDTKDYKAGGLARQNVVLRVHRMLQLSDQNEEFRNGLIGLIHEGLGTCGDRVLITFNEIEILWNFLHKELSQEEAKDLSIRAQRYELLKRHAQEECKRLRLGDQIETILAFHIRLNTALNLPITTENMLYPGMSGVTEDMLREAEKKIGSISDEELLNSSFHWQEYIKKTQGLSVVGEIDARYGDLLEDLETYYSHLSEESEESKKPSRAAAFLESRQNLRELMAEAEGMGVASNYLNMANFLSQKREQEIARLGY